MIDHIATELLKSLCLLLSGA